ncbi:MAG: HD-GYP domain-containing protein [Leptothrix sp. (in: b-proteobacteria)]
MPSNAPPPKSADSASRVWRRVDLDALRPGLYVVLELGWMSHPFARNQFKLTEAAQIETLRHLGVREVRIRTDLSDADALAALDRTTAGDIPAKPISASAGTGTSAAPESAPAYARPTTDADTAQAQRRAEFAAQQRSLARSVRLQALATRTWLGAMRDVLAEPKAAQAAIAALATQLVDDLLGDEQTTIRLLTEAAGTAASTHALNVTMLALLLARKLGLSEADLHTVAQGALVHDIGKLALPDHLKHVDAGNAALRLRERDEHVVQGVRLGMAMGLDAATLRVLAQHHERHDGSGTPRGLAGDAISLPARLVALVDAFDKLCNPGPGEPARTPHEAQSLLFAQMRQRLDPALLGAFIQLIGVYPPGSVVQLSDERLALVVAVDPQHPLLPSVVVHDPRVPRDQALVLPLHQQAGLAIRRSLHPQNLPRAVVDYLSPRERLSYCYAHGLDVSPPERIAA